MPPIRIGLIGLSASSDTGWAAKAHLPYLLSSPKYQITALCNTSTRSAQQAIEHFKLPSSTKAYGSSEEMAQDTSVDLAVCVTGVEHHYKTLVPLLEAGKDVYTEVPLAVNISEVRELQAVAERNKVRTMIGMQGQANPAVKAIKNTIAQGRIGRVLSTTITGYAGAFNGDPRPDTSIHLFQRAAGANMMTVWFLHTFNFVLDVLGELASFNSMLGISHPKVGIFDVKDSAKRIIRTVETNTPDQIFIQGKLLSNALLTFHMEGGEPFPGEPGLRWHIVGDEGELMITNNIMMMDVLHTGAKILLLEYCQRAASDKGDFLNDIPHGQQTMIPVEIEPLQDAMTELGGVAQNVGRLYEAFADERIEDYADWTVGLRRHELMEEMFQRWDGKAPFAYTTENKF